MNPMRGARRRTLIFSCVLLAALAGGIALSLNTGPAGETTGRITATLLDGLQSLVSGTPHEPSAIHTIIWDIRLPRVLLAVLVGVSLALSGTLMQALFQNPMADPYIIGVSAGAALGAVTAMMLGIGVGLGSVFGVPLMAFAGALAVTFTVYALACRGGKVQIATLLLTGIAVGSLIAAVNSFIMMRQQQDLRLVNFWLLGGLGGRGWLEAAMILPPLIIGGISAVVMARPLNAMLLGDEAAAGLGVNVGKMRLFLLTTASLLAAGAVAVSGMIGFVGLIVPHIARLVVGPNHRHLLPVAALTGALLLVFSDVAARVIVAPSELPVGIITNALGCPFFLYLLHRHGSRGM